jgi:hypothetical protein
MAKKRVRRQDRLEPHNGLLLYISLVSNASPLSTNESITPKGIRIYSIRFQKTSIFQANVLQTDDISVFDACQIQELKEEGKQNLEKGV